MDGKAGKGANRVSVLNFTLLFALGQVGCLTLLIVLGAAFGGLYLDTQFNTKPFVTIILLLGSVPVSLVITLAIVRSAAAKMKLGTEKNKPDQQEEE